MRKKVIPLEPSNKFKIIDIPIGILFTIAFIAIGLAIAINFRPLYYLNIGWQELEQSSGLTSEVIRENYDALIDYCSPFYSGELSFPSLSASESGLSHFAEVKVIFNAIYIAGAISVIACAVIIFFKRRSRQYHYLFVSCITSLVLPVILCLASAINFEAFFNLFHRIAFSNDDWMFNPATDPVITILPEAYFMQCGLLIAITVIAGSAVLFIRYRVHEKRKKGINLLPQKKNYYY